ncbi:MAG: hypothetical protein WC140_05195 [Bacteroidales bacterium]
MPSGFFILVIDATVNAYSLGREVANTPKSSVLIDTERLCSTSLGAAIPEL